MAKRNVLRRKIQGMRKLSNYTEEEILKIIEGIANTLAPKYVFPGYEVEDIRQEAFLLGLEGVENYNEKYKLPSFLFTHIGNRLKTFKRDEYYRMEQGSAKDIQNKKRMIKSPHGYSDEYFSIDPPEDEIYYKDIIEKIDRGLPAENRSDFLRLLDGEKISRIRKDNLIDLIKEIVDINGLDYPYFLEN